MGSILTNGVFLPAEGERNCYEGLAANWTALDRLIGGYNVHIGNTAIHVTAEDKNKWNGKADASALTAHTGDTTIHVTAEDKATWNGKADASALTAHTGDTTIHVTAEDKQAWDGHVADSVKHVTAEDKAKWDAVTSKADDSDVVHKSGDETVVGNKTFPNNIIVKKIISNVAQLQINAKSNADSVAIIAGANATDGGGIWIYGKNHANKSNVSIQVYDTDASTYHAVRLNMDGSLTPTVSNNGLGSQSFKWRSFNGLNPSSLGMPNLSNGIDISGYITIGDTDNNYYTPPANGWIWIRLIGNGASIVQGDFGINSSYVTNNLTTEKWVETNLFVTKDVQAIIRCRSITGIIGAKFYPCQGNV